MDRAGMVGADGATHCGFADVTYMSCLPNMVVMAPSNEARTPPLLPLRRCCLPRGACTRGWAVCAVHMLCGRPTACASTCEMSQQHVRSGLPMGMPSCSHKTMLASTGFKPCLPKGPAGRAAQRARDATSSTSACSLPEPPPGGHAAQAELCNALATSIAIDDRPSCFRFPRGNGIGVDLAAYGVAPNLKGTAWEVRGPWVKGLMIG